MAWRMWGMAAVVVAVSGLAACDDGEAAGVTADATATTEGDASVTATEGDASASTTLEDTSASTSPEDTSAATTEGDTSAGTSTPAGDTSVASDATTEDATGDTADVVSEAPRVRVVLFTHIEDNTPVGDLGSDASRAAYLGLRGKLIRVAELAAQHGVRWTLQPDWKFLEAARLYETSDVMASTGGVNLLVHLRDELGVVIDPHSHENGGYNYTDVAHLLDLLGVGGSTVIGGHIWDPALPQFQHWERFREPVAGEHYPDATWRGDILIGSGTPNHVNDPLVSGLWRPTSPSDYWTDDPAANIVAIGSWHDQVTGVEELVARYADGTVPKHVLLTASWNVTPSAIVAPNGPDQIASTVFAPLAVMAARGEIETTDFTTLVATWRDAFGARAYTYAP